ncbi:site-2 protease family protein [Streptomyces sp. RKAG293]|uniref:site-2 protease family protein n=1 Tax=Streptomyces sp. RKAG293 TaxID=2893403 RepID=UPI002033AE32|nr:site-2 protease family protein [Streptomyces sp. RKAG293]MCM2416526.1 site-2 protease family protein [Streptomyces sp. RKAG293]
MAGAVGVLLGGTVVVASIALHEAAHAGTAKLFGMKVDRLFFGFGPTLWSTRSATTEYGVKAVPLGGFADIPGLEHGEARRRTGEYVLRTAVWKRTTVLAAGSTTHFLLGFILFWTVAATASVANSDNPGPYVDDHRALTQPPFVSVLPRLGNSAAASPTVPAPAGPAWSAGLREGDRITSVGHHRITTYGDLVRVVPALSIGRAVTVAYVRDGVSHQTSVTPVAGRKRPPGGADGPNTVVTVGIGLSYDPALPRRLRFTAVTAVPVAASWFGEIMDRAATSLDPTAHSWNPMTFFTSRHRDTQSPVSIVGVARANGQDFSSGQYGKMFGSLAALNIFAGFLNLLPLPLTDGGRIALAWFRALPFFRSYETGRDPVVAVSTLLVSGTVVLFFAFTLLTAIADIVNPVTP